MQNKRKERVAYFQDVFDLLEERIRSQKDDQVDYEEIKLLMTRLEGLIDEAQEILESIMLAYGLYD